MRIGTKVGGLLACVALLAPASASAYRTLGDELDLEVPVRQDAASVEVLLHGDPPPGVSVDQLEVAVALVAARL